MNSQIYESDDAKPESPTAKIDRSIAQLKQERAEIAKRRRALIEPEYKTVMSSPTDMHHKITLGAVLVNAGMRAADADAIAGLLALTAGDFADRYGSVAMARPQANVGEIMLHMIDGGSRELSALGLHDAWMRRFAAYSQDRAEWLSRDVEFRLEGAWRAAPMTSDQRWLVRVTCRLLDIAMPGHFLRGQAADWLESQGANLNYGDFA